MATTTQITKLPEVLRSPSSAQYLAYKNKVKQSKPHFKPRFTFKLADREHTLLGKDPRWRHTDPLMPPYPYGENMHFPEANFGLYGGATVTTGSKISKGRNKGKTVRHFFPNVRVEKVRSEALDKELKIPITARVMRTIKKLGGVDQYVTGTKPARIKELGLLGWKLRWLVMTSRKYRVKHALELRKHNLPKHYSLEGTFEDAWNDDTVRAKMMEQQEAAWQDLRHAAERFENHVQRNWVNSGEKESYALYKLDTLNKSSPYTLGLPQQLAKPSVAREKSKHPRTFQGPVSEDEVALLAAEEEANAAQAARTIPANDSIPDRVKDKIEGLTMKMKAQDLGLDPAKDDAETIERRIDAIKEIMEARMPVIEDEISTAKAEEESLDKAGVPLAKTAEAHEARIDEEHVEQHAEHHLDAVREEMKQDQKDEAQSDSSEAKQKPTGKPGAPNR